MKISKIKLENFRGYCQEVEISCSDLTTFIGKNDIGKSTILEALDIFFNEGKGRVKFDKSDLSCYRKDSNNESIITVCFTDLPEKVIIDETVETTLADEYMLNKDNELEVIKKYTSSSSPRVFIRANHPKNQECCALLAMKNKELKEICENLNLKDVELAKNASMRRAIRKYYGEELELEEMLIDIKKEGAKQIYDKLSAFFPIYFLFQADRKNSDSDSEIQDPLKLAVEEILKDEKIMEELQDVAQKVEEKLKDVSNRTLTKLNEMDESIAQSLQPVIPKCESLKWNSVFKDVTIAGDESIPINKRGSGVKRLILLNFFRAEAERKAEEKEHTGIIYAIEEPETSQHFHNQRVLINALKELSKVEKTQVLLTTHSSIIVKELEFSDLRMIQKKDQEREIVLIQPNILPYPSLNEVNYLAFNEISEEYHNELYGFLEENSLLEGYNQTKQTRKYIREKKDGSTKEEQKTLTEYIRHQIHHPENRHNVRFTYEELRKSVEDMRSYII